MIELIEPVFRPPAEHDSILIQITTGCSYNQCLFCGMYKSKPFQVKDDIRIEHAILYAAEHYQDRKRLFLCDGDALAIPHNKLMSILDKIRTKLPWLTRIGIYASARNIATKSDLELKEMRSMRVGILYVGLESGDDIVLSTMKKGADSAFQIKHLLRAKDAGFKLSCMVLLGLGGRERSREHVLATAKMLNAIKPSYISALSLMVIPEAPLYKAMQDGKFSELSPRETLTELRGLLTSIECEGSVFSANHASNYLPLQIRLPAGKANALKEIDEAIEGQRPTTPDMFRGL